MTELTNGEKKGKGERTKMTEKLGEGKRTKMTNGERKAKAK